LLQSFFTIRLMTQRKVSPHTIASYRDTFRLLLQFAQKRLRKDPSQLELENLDASLVGAFLEDLENRRGNGARSRNLRLTAIRSFFRYASLEAPAHSGIIQRVLAIPNKRQPRALVGFLTRPEIEALLEAPNPATWLGRRDHAFLITAVQTGLRLSEMTALRREDVSLGAGAHVRCRGKGRKERCTPLAKPTAAVLKAWIREQGREDSKTLFPSTRGRTFECRWRSTPARTPRDASAQGLRFAAKETSLTTCPAARRRHGVATGRCGSSGDCALARP
jgi:integrase/recombinase XerD